MNPFLSAVNRKQFFARLLLDKCLPGEDPYGHAAQALAESALYQLESAYRHHLRAVAWDYRCADTDNVGSVETLISALEAVDKHPAEASEMQHLEEDDQSWLYAMLTAWRDLSAVNVQEGRVGIEKVGIALQEIQEHDGLKPASVRPWMTAFEEMVSRHREMMIEC